MPGKEVCSYVVGITIYQWVVLRGMKRVTLEIHTQESHNYNVTVCSVYLSVYPLPFRH